MRQIHAKLIGDKLLGSVCFRITFFVDQWGHAIAKWVNNAN